MVTSFSHIFCWKLYLEADHNKIVFIVHKSWFARISITQRSFFIALTLTWCQGSWQAVQKLYTQPRQWPSLRASSFSWMTGFWQRGHHTMSPMQSSPFCKVLFEFIYLYPTPMLVVTVIFFIFNWKQKIVAYMFMIVYVYKNLWLNHQYFNKIMTFKNGLLIMAY